MLVPSRSVVALLRAIAAGAALVSPTRGLGPLDRAIALVSAALCLLFAATLRDARALVVERAEAPLVAATSGAVEVRVFDAEGAPVPRAIVRAFAIRPDGVVSLGGEREVARDESARFEGLPHGEVWVLTYAEGRARGSARVRVDDEARSVVIALAAASALDAHVVDAEGVPVAEAEVRVLGRDALPAVASTNAEGSARLERLTDAPWTVEVRAEGFAPLVRKGIPATSSPVELRLERRAGFAIAVVGPDDEPAPFAEVQLAGPGLWPARTATTDARGELFVADLAPGLYDLRAVDGDRASRTQLCERLGRGKVVELTLRLEEGRFVTVHVTDGEASEGRPAPGLEGADVVLVEGGLSSFPLEARTSAGGVAVIGPVTDAIATISAHAPGFVSRLARADAIRDDEATIALLRGGTIEGDVRDERGRPILGATIEVVGTDLDGMPVHEAHEVSDFDEDLRAFSRSGPVPLVPRGELGVVPGPVPPIPRGEVAAAPGTSTPNRTARDPWMSGRGGAFEVAPVPPGQVQLLVRHPEFVEALSEVVSLAPGARREVHVVLARGGRLEGRVLEEDRAPVAGARVEIAALEGSFEAHSYSLDDGTFSAASLPREVLVSVARAETPGEVAARVIVPIDPERRASLEITLPKPREAVTLLVADDRRSPLARVEVHVASLDRAGTIVRTLFTDDDGRVVVPGARGLPLLVRLEHPGHAPLALELDPSEAEHRVVLDAGRTLRGTITARDGRDRLEGAELTLYTDTGARHAKSDARGEFEVSDMAPGRVRLVARAKGHAVTERVILFEGDARRPVTIEPLDLPRAGRVTGVVIDASDQPIRGARVGYGGVPTYLPVGPLPRGLAQTDGDGRFELDDVPEGEVTLEAYSAALGRGRAERVVVRAGRTTDRVAVTIPEQDYDPRKPRGAGSVAVTLAERAGGVFVVDVPEGGEAEHAGLEPDDRVLAIFGTSVATIEAARDALGGPTSEDVVLTIERADPKGGARSRRLRIRREVVRR